jgi:Ca2+-binding EF-hand superfamily protein
MGHDEVNDEQAGALLSRFDKDNSGFIEWVEFLDMMQTIKVRGKKSGLDNIVKEIKGVGAGQA